MSDTAAIDLDELERLAREAMTGPWKACGADRGGCSCGAVWDATESVVILRANSHEIDSMGEGPYEEHQKHNQLYIAAVDPTVTLALIAAARERASEARDVWIVDVPGDDRYEAYRTEQAAVFRADELCEADVPVVSVRRYVAYPTQAPS